MKVNVSIRIQIRLDSCLLSLRKNGLLQQFFFGRQVKKYLNFIVGIYFFIFEIKKYFNRNSIKGKNTTIITLSRKRYHYNILCMGNQDRGN